MLYYQNWTLLIYKRCKLQYQNTHEHTHTHIHTLVCVSRVILF